MKGRGSEQNLPNRFEATRRERWPEDEIELPPDPRTQFFPDVSKTIVAKNESPDVGFNASVNPYRGCEHGCNYCVSGDTLILMGDGSTKPISNIRTGEIIYGTRRSGWYRQYIRTQVLNHWQTDKPAYQITLEDGTQLTASADHRFLTDRGWKFVTGREQGRHRRSHLTINNKLMGIGQFAEGPRKDEDYQRGYLCGLIKGDGLLKTFFYHRKGRVNGNQHQFRLALVDKEPLQQARHFLESFGIYTFERPFRNQMGKKPMEMIRTSSRGQVEEIKKITAWPSTQSPNWRKGFLAGIFDAEGSYSAGILRITNSDPIIINNIVRSFETLGFDSITENRKPHPSNKKLIQTVRLRGGLQQYLRFFHVTNPTIVRKRDFEGESLKNNAPLRVISIERKNISISMFDITTGTGDFMANGVVSHNCYARPTHEYLGFSSGLDFETKIMVKEKAPDLLREALSKPSWKPQVVAMSGVTDGYQPIERKLELTRRCLQVLAEFRNPVFIITKNFLVTRDLDYLKELAQHQAVAVALSVTSLKPELCGVMEPRTSRPARRLEAVRILAEAGIPVGVNIQPVIPGLTDEEIPSIVKASVDAGARFAGITPVRLPHGVKDLFTQWLETHFPDRKEKILHRIQSLRGGKLNDPNFRTRMKGEGAFATQIQGLFKMACQKYGLPQQWPLLSTKAFRCREEPQRSLFEF